jgi:hypothetical protein
MVVVLAGATYGVETGRCIQPLGAPESGSIEFFKKQATRGRVLTFFDWGEYAIWHLSPDVLVSMDGRRETVYSEDLVSAHMQFYDNGPGAAVFAESLHPDFIWLPTRLPVVQTLVNEGWHPIFRGSVSTILGRERAKTLVDLQDSETGRCFPNP